MRIDYFCYLSQSILGFIILLVASNSAAQVLEEVIVTAQKREQSIQNVGISITSFTGDQIKALGFKDSIDITRLTPGIHSGGASAGQKTLFTIRGVTQNDFTDSVESPVAVYIDEGYIAAPQGQVFGLLDIDRVEVAKGPQSSLFGRNATGGVIRYITRKPTFDFEAFADLSYGSYNQVKFEGAVSGPLSDAIAGRVAVLYNRHDEILDNNITDDDAPVHPVLGPLAGSTGGGDDMWDDDTLGIRGHLLFTPRANMEVLFTASYGRTEVASAAYQARATLPIVLDNNGNGVFEPWLGEQHVNTIENPRTNSCEAVTPAGGCVAVLGVDGELRPTDITFAPGFAAPEDGLRPALPNGQFGDFFGYIDADGPDLDTRGDFAFGDLDEFETLGFSGQLTWDLSDTVRFTGVADYKNVDRISFLDVDASPTPQSFFHGEAETDQFSLELRLNGELDRVRWVAGFYYLLIDNKTTNGLGAPPMSPLMGDAIQATPTVVEFVPFAGTEGNGIIDLETNSYSVFGQLEFDITDKLTFIGGLRTVWENKNYSLLSGGFLNLSDSAIETETLLFPLAVESATFGNTFNDDHKETIWGGKAQFDYHLTDDILLYAGVNRGVKAFGYNAQLQDGSPRLPPDEIRYDNEVLFSYEGGFKASLFGGTTRLNGAIYFYDYDSYQAFLFTTSSGVVVNNDAKTIGGEIELITSPMAGLDLLFSAAAFDATVTNLQVARGVSRDVDPAYAPEVQFAGIARYEWPAFGGRLAIQGDFTYSDSFFYNLRNFDSQEYDDYVFGNARISYLSRDDRWQASFFVENIGDERYGVMGFDLSTVCGCDQDYRGKPRWFGVNVRYNF